MYDQVVVPDVFVSVYGVVPVPINITRGVPAGTFVDVTVKLKPFPFMPVGFEAVKVGGAYVKVTGVDVIPCLKAYHAVNENEGVPVGFEYTKPGPVKSATVPLASTWSNPVLVISMFPSTVEEAFPLKTIVFKTCVGVFKVIVGIPSKRSLDEPTFPDVFAEPYSEHVWVVRLYPYTKQVESVLQAVSQSAADTEADEGVPVFAVVFGICVEYIFDIPTPRRLELIFIPESTVELPELNRLHVVVNLKNSHSCIELHTASHWFADVIPVSAGVNCLADE